MRKQNYVRMARGKRVYKVYTEDIKAVRTARHKKRPALPKYTEITES